MRIHLKNARKAKGMTQQQMADELGVGLRHYQKIESGDTNGSFEIWDALEDILGIHQRKLREISNTHHGLKENQLERLRHPPNNQPFKSWTSISAFVFSIFLNPVWSSSAKVCAVKPRENPSGTKSVFEHKYKTS